MNMDDFEKRLQRQPMRQVPGEWREEILAAATAQERKFVADEAIPLWHLIFAKFPVATGAFATVWIALIAINLLLFGTSNQSVPRKEFAGATEPSSIWRLQSAELQQLASGGESISTKRSGAVPDAAPRGPRSDRRREDGLGEIMSHCPVTSFA
jgi:hypothetical protein